MGTGDARSAAARALRSKPPLQPESSGPRAAKDRHEVRLDERQLFGVTDRHADGPSERGAEDHVAEVVLAVVDAVPVL